MKLCISGLPVTLSREDVRDLCEPFGELADLEVTWDDGECCAWVVYETTVDAEVAMHELHGARVRDRTIQVDEAIAA